MADVALASTEPSPASRPASVPVIDISGFKGGSDQARRRIADAINAACRDIGFFVVTGHGVPDELIARVKQATRTFYDLPPEKKAEYTSPRRGYFGFGRQAVAQSMGDKKTVPDSHEIYSMGQDIRDPADPYYSHPRALKVFSPNVWPDASPDFEAAWKAYSEAMEDLSKTLLEIFELALGLPKGWFWPRFDKHMSTMSANNYPDQRGVSREGQTRMGGHTDFGAFTLLRAENKLGGLEVLARDGVWESVPLVEGSYIVNVGDMLKRWTNDIWESSLHKVANPPVDATEDTRRLSLVFFLQPNHDVVIEPLPIEGVGEAKHAPIAAGDLLISRVDAMRATKPAS